VNGTREVVGGKIEASVGILDEVPLGAAAEEEEAEGIATRAGGGRADPEAMD